MTRPAHKVDGCGRLLLYRARPWQPVDWSILFQTCARGRVAYVHSAFLYPSGTKVIEACVHGVRVRAFDDAEYADQFSIRGMTALDWKRVLASAEKEIGKRYDFRNIIRFITREQPADDDHWFCSELTEEKLALEGFPLLNPQRVKPCQVAPVHQGMSNELIQDSPLMDGHGMEAI